MCRATCSPLQSPQAQKVRAGQQQDLPTGRHGKPHALPLASDCFCLCPFVLCRVYPRTSNRRLCLGSRSGWGVSWRRTRRCGLRTTGLEGCTRRNRGSRAAAAAAASAAAAAADADAASPASAAAAAAAAAVAVVACVWRCPLVCLCGYRKGWRPKARGGGGGGMREFVEISFVSNKLFVGGRRVR